MNQRPDNAGKPENNRGRGREHAPGQNKPKTFVNPTTGEEEVSTMLNREAMLERGFVPKNDDVSDEPEPGDIS